MLVNMLTEEELAALTEVSLLTLFLTNYWLFNPQ
jgi:hypothetical protein